VGSYLETIYTVLAANPMKSERLLLLIDAIINLGLGALLIVFPRPLVTALGVPATESAFYPSILGAVLFGIGIALILQLNRANGLALKGAVSINLCGGIVLGVWLLFGRLQLPLRGLAFLWGLVVVIVSISIIEILALRHNRKGV
jgi:hypothetical protein